MKKYNRSIAVSVIIYLVLAVTGGILLLQQQNRANQWYKVEINRIIDGLEDTFVQPDMDLYEHVKKVEFLEADSTEFEVKAFFEQPNHVLVQIQPWYRRGSFRGYLRFAYTGPDINAGYQLAVCEGMLLCLELCILFFLLYLKRRLVKPFHQMSQLPYELAKGHLRGEVTEEKEKYLGDFMRGVGHLKDTLAVTRKRELELLKEKKLMLLSLSHDIKTPLNTIRLYEKALAEDLYDSQEKKQHALAQIARKTEEIEKYVEDIMEAAREDILDIQVQDGEFYLTDLMKKVLAVYREKCGFRMTELLVGEYENCLIKGDLERSFEVFENIFENAFKYGDGKRIEITFSQEEGFRLVRIYNTGVPVSDNDINHIFESFFRGANSGRQQGNGLGLYICREIMRRMGGEIYTEKCVDGMGFVLVFA